MAVRTRFAPSPTGYLHIGGARTALFNFLFARHHDGCFVLRIEDTDRERSTPESIQAILDGLTWLGLTWDEGPHHQSHRGDVYRDHVDRLTAAGHTYRCWCTPEELDAKRRAAVAAGTRAAYDRTCRDRDRAPDGRGTFVVRFRTPPDGETVVDDQVKGRVTFRHAQLDDFVILRSDGSPVYNFCAAVDDIDMRITHVIRGDDHLANTPRQALLYRALGATPPVFAHLPLILGLDRTRLSKRHGATAVTAYRDEGYLPAALVNYLARLGWSHGDQELFSAAELVEHFDLGSVGRAAGVFNPEKLLWVNAQHLKITEPHVLADLALPFIRRSGLAVPADRAWLTHAVATLRERAGTLAELAEGCRVYLTDPVSVNAAAAAKHLTPAVAPALRDLTERLRALATWDVASIEGAFGETVGAHAIKLGRLAQPVRVAVIGGTVSPGIYDVLALVGRERVLARLHAALATLTDTPTRDPTLTP